jgi:hypothetical protein
MGDKLKVKNLYYITHVNNIPSILERGVLSHDLVKAEGIHPMAIYDEDIISSRKNKTTPDGKSLWSYANFYFQPRNPMLFRVTCEKSIDNIAVIALRADVLNQQGTLVTDGNAASGPSMFYSPSQLSNVLSRIGKQLDEKYWSEQDGSKRKIMAEILVPDKASPEFIESIYVANYDVCDKVRQLIQTSSLPIIPQPEMFFQPQRRIDLTTHLSVLEGDLFFSRLQTLTVSVNIVRVMGAGLASRAKYQFPDVYVKYQDLCRDKTLQMGKPYLYKREASLDLQLADEPEKLTNANAETWFLLFPTKRHWKEKADLNGIKKGLEWLQENYNNEGIKSLAVPALGCGLGWLKWEEVGPIICSFLYSLEIPVQLYLPVERKIDDKFLSPDFLLGKLD